MWTLRIGLVTALVLGCGLWPGQAKELTLAIGLALPPYVLSESNSGMELDIVRDALASQGHSIMPSYLPFARVPKHLQAGEVDGALTITEASGVTNVHYSDSHITYQNVAVSLRQSNFKIDTIEDLSNKVIIAFQSATKYLGPRFEAMAKANPAYQEFADQEQQVAMLFKQRTETLVLDLNIFKYYRQKLRIDTTLPVTIHHIFPANPYKVAFIDPHMRDAFNKGLKALRASGQYEQIVKKYVNE